MGQDQSLKRPLLRPEWTLDRMQKQCEGYLPDLIGMQLVSVIPGKLSSRLKVRPDLMAPNGFLHAATIIGLADTTCGFGTFAHLPEGAASFTTAELKTNFLGTIRQEWLLVRHSWSTLVGPCKYGVPRLLRKLLAEELLSFVVLRSYSGANLESTDHHLRAPCNCLLYATISDPKRDDVKSISSMNLYRHGSGVVKL